MARLRVIAVGIGALIVLAAVYGLGIATGPTVQQRVLSAEQPAGLEEQFKVFWEAWNLVDERFVDREALDPEKRIYGAIEGQLDALGDLGHTRFLSPEELKEEQEGLAGHFGGVGAEINVRDGRPTIVTPLDGSPAERAGMEAGDIVVAVDGEDVTHLTLRDVIRRIRGTKGTTVSITVIHPGKTVPVDLTMVREDIQVPSVTANYFAKSAIAHVRITQFAESANEQLVAALRSMRQRGAKALIVDVRNNPGGLLDQAISVSSQFLKEGNVLQERDSAGKRRSFPVHPGGVATDIPMVVLINRGSASAAEIFAGAIKDNHRAKVIGERTFGTGTVLTSFSLSDGSGILLATSEWLTPNGRAIKDNGIQPDIAVALASDREPLSLAQEQKMSEDDVVGGDAQIAAAVATLNAMLQEAAPAGRQ